MRSPPLPWPKDAIAVYRKRLIADNPDCPPPADKLAILRRWEKNTEWDSCWKKLQEKLPVEDMPTAEEFIWLVLSRSDVARCLDEINRGTPTAAEAEQRSKAYLSGKRAGAELMHAYAELAHEHAALAELNQMRTRLIGRQKENVERKRFIMDWRDKFTERCGQPLDEVVRVLTEIVYGGKVDIGVIRGVRRPTTKRARKKRDTRPAK
jgi:hypothetical protein